MVTNVNRRDIEKAVVGIFQMGFMLKLQNLIIKSILGAIFYSLVRHVTIKD